MADFLKRCLLSKLDGTLTAKSGLDLELGSCVKSGKCCQKLIQLYGLAFGLER